MIWSLLFLFHYLQWAEAINSFFSSFYIFTYPLILFKTELIMVIKITEYHVCLFIKQGHLER